ncbi:MAG TPA: hypothetical protein VFW73_08975 [Lacipirellulaceae bacterium]|nr:hypothetical protein [Lacipirellulaceae bacterium]
MALYRLTSSGEAISGATPSERSGLSFRFAVTVTLVFCAAGTSFMFYRLGQSSCQPSPVQVFERQRDVFEHYVRKANSGAIRSRDDGRGYLIPAALFDEGVSQISSADSCLVFYFASLPPDSIEEIIWSPDGCRGLPLHLDSLGRNTIHELVTLDNEWFYMRRY